MTSLLQQIVVESFSSRPDSVADDAGENQSEELKKYLINLFNVYNKINNLWYTCLVFNLI